MPNDNELPLLGDVTAAELLHAAFPLVVQASTQAATAATMAAEQGRASEAALGEFKAALDKNTDAINRYAQAIEEQNQIASKKNAAEEEGQRRLYQTVQSSFTSPVLLQLLQLFILIGASIGLWSAMPEKGATIEAMDSPPVQHP
jgi:hypothetical protein